MDLKMDFATLHAQHTQDMARTLEDKKLSEYFESKIKPALADIERKRPLVIAQVARSHKMAVISGVVGVIAFFVCSFAFPKLARFVVYVFLGSVLYHVAAAKAALKAYFRSKRDIVLESVLDLFGDFSLCPRGMIPDLLRSSGIGSVFANDPAVTGMNGDHAGAKLCIGGLSGWVKQGKSSTPVHALYVAAEYHAPFEGETRVFSIKRPSVIGMPAGSLQAVTLEANEFMRAFRVFSTSQVEARYLLHPEMMADLLDFFALANVRGLDCAFAAGRMHMLLHLSHPPFQAMNSLEPVDIEAVKAVHVEVARLLEMVEHLEVSKVRLT